MKLMRLQKIISSAGVCSRRKAESYILDGFVTVNGLVVNILGSKADPDIDEICVKERVVTRCNKFTYIMLNKPRGYVTSCHQPNTKIVTDLVNLPNRLFPVGRLDKDSTGLLLMTNDGRIHHRLSHPSFGHEKEYYVETMDPISKRFILTMSRGIVLDGKITGLAKVIRISNNEFKITLTEGRNRQIRRMVKYLKNKVLVLKRIRVENIKLGSLTSGEWRYLSQKEREDLIDSLDLR